MWVDKDDVFADDKVREFKSSHPDARTHIRRLWKDGIPQFTLSPSTSSSSSSYFAPHVLPMSNGSTPARRSTPGIPASRVPSPSLTKVYEALRVMSLNSPSQSGGESTNARSTCQYNLPIPYPRIDGDEDGVGVALGTIATVPFAVGEETPAEDQAGANSDNPDYQPDMRPCPRGCGPLEYCHGHSPTPLSPSPLPIRPRPIQP